MLGLHGVFVAIIPERMMCRLHISGGRRQEKNRQKAKIRFQVEGPAYRIRRLLLAFKLADRGNDCKREKAVI